jgi:hypothetical protein
MDESLRAQIETYLSQLDVLIRRGYQIRDILANDPANGASMGAIRVWQEDCGVTVNQLSGGSKAHWLARSFSEAFLMRSTAGSVVEEVPEVQIVDRLIDVLEQAVGSISRMDASASPRMPVAPRRFDFVHNPRLRPVVEQAYVDGRSALDQGEYDVALLNSCGILEAIVTDALEHKGQTSLSASGAPIGKIADWPFETRLAVADRAGLISSGWARLPAVARTYRDRSNASESDGPKARVSERDARKAGQVLQVVMRDLNPSR